MSARAPTGFLANLNPLAPLRALHVNRELLWQFTQRNFHARHKGSYLGMTWAVLNPLLLLGLYFAVFQLIFKGSFGVLPNETRVDYALALLLGLTVFHFLSEIIATSPAIIVANPNLVKKVVFPVEVLPVANLGASFFNFAISLLLVLVGQLVLGRGVPASVVWLPVLVLPVVLLGLGTGWLLAALGVFFRDISQVVQFLSLVLMWASAVFYSMRIVPPEIHVFLRFNPIAQAIELLRDALLWDVPVNLLHVGYLYGVTALICLIGYATFAALRPTFADVI